MYKNKVIPFLFSAILLTACSTSAAQLDIVLPTSQPTLMDAPCDPNNRYTYYAQKDGYDERVGSGFLLLKVGNSYSFEMYCNPKQIEVQRVSDKQQLGFALLIPTYSSTGNYAGYEKPIAFVDSNNDGLVGTTELDAAITTLREEIKQIKTNQSSYADRFEKEIDSAEEAKSKGAIADSYLQVKQLQIEINAFNQAVKEQSANNSINEYLIIGLVIVGLFLVIAFFIQMDIKKSHRPEAGSRRRALKKGGTNSIMDNVAKAAFKQAGEEELESKQSPNRLGIMVCPACKMKVIPKDDDTCPNCHIKLLTS